LPARGWSNARIAEALGAQDQVVTRLLSDIYRKVGSDQAGLPRLIGMQGGASPTPHD
jgi:DNA-binding NarL/FixJ family response regulator